MHSVLKVYCKSHSHPAIRQTEDGSNTFTEASDVQSPSTWCKKSKTRNKIDFENIVKVIK